jgi:DNA-binding FadR family transcriptional regulator
LHSTAPLPQQPNLQFWAFLDYLGRFVMPRQSIRVAAHQAGGQRAYLEMIQGEHRTIFAAIQSGNPAAARETMRRHLSNSQARYRRLSEDAESSVHDALRSLQ